MKNHHFLSAGLAGCTLLAAGMTLLQSAAATDADDIAALIAVDKEQQHAYITKDVAALERIFTDDYVLVLSSGRERRKAEILSDMQSPEAHWDINETSGWAVRVHGDTGMVVATLHQKGVDHGRAFDSWVKFSDTYVRENGAWRNVHGHASVATPAEKKEQKAK